MDRCSKYKTPKVPAIETVINNMLVHSLTSLSQVNSFICCYYDAESDVWKLCLCKGIQKKMFSMIKFTF